MKQEAYHPFRSADAQTEYLAYYDRLAQGWPVPSQTRMVDTAYGQTFVRLSGPVDAPPLVLLPGGALNSTMWLPNIEALSQKYRTYAVDQIYDTGRSIYTHAPKTVSDLLDWLDELLTKLGLGDSISLMGLSYGGWLTLQYALRFPHRLAKIVLLAPPGIVSFPAGFIFRFFFCFIRPTYLKTFFYWIFTDSMQKGGDTAKMAESLVEGMQLDIRCYKARRMVLPKIMKDEELQALQVPTLYLVGENDKTCTPHKAVERFQKLALQVQTEIIPTAGHDLTFVQARVVNDKILSFFQKT